MMVHMWYNHYIDVYYGRSSNKTQCSICLKIIKDDRFPIHMFDFHKGTPVACPFNCSVKTLTFTNFKMYWKHLCLHAKFQKDNMNTNTSDSSQSIPTPTHLGHNPRSQSPLLPHLPDSPSCKNPHPIQTTRYSHAKSSCKTSSNDDNKITPSFGSLSPSHHSSSASINTPGQNQEQPIFGKCLKSMKTPPASSSNLTSSSPPVLLPQPVASIKKPDNPL